MTMIRYITIDYRMFAVANSKELLNSAALIIYQQCLKFRAKVMNFTSDAKNAGEWYAFEYAKDKIFKYDSGQYRDPKRELYPTAFQPWKDALDECGKLLGNNGIVFCLFNIKDPNEPEELPIAYYSSPGGVGRQSSGPVKAAWSRNFEKGIRHPVYMIGSQLIPYELNHVKKAPRQIYYPAYADSSYDLMLEKRREKLAQAQKKKKPAAQPAEPEKKKGYYEIADENPEKIPFGINDLQEYIRKGISEATRNPIRIPAEYADCEKYLDLAETVKIRGKHFTLAGAGELYDDLKGMIEAGGGILHKDVVQKDDYLVICFGVETFDEAETKRNIENMIYMAQSAQGKKSKIKIVTDYQLLNALQQEQE